MLVRQSYKYDVSPEYSFTVEFLQEDTSLYSNKPGYQNIDYMPMEGTTVTIYSNVIGASGFVNFKPTLNNNFYWLVSNDVLMDRDEILSQATALSPGLVSGRYQASFTFNNPDGYQYLYLISDYTNFIVMGSSVTHTFVNGTIEVIDTELASDVGLAQISYTPSAVPGPIRIAVEYEGNIVADTGDIAPVSGSLKFVKRNPDSNDVRVIVRNKGLPNSILVKNDGVTLTPFYIDADPETLEFVCGQIADYQVYHNGLGSLPVAGDIIYDAADGSAVFDGGNAYHVMSLVAMVVPSASSVYAGIMSDGTVSSTGTCVCSEVAVPVITQTDIVVTQNQYFNIGVEVTNNPNSWTFVTSCVEYLLDGGLKGSTFTYTDCDGDVKRCTSGSTQQQVVCASVAPTVVSGTGTVTAQGPCAENSLPNGIEFKDGIIFGKPVTTGRTTIELIAENCFGFSANATFDVIVEASYNLRPFGINQLEPEDTGADACLIVSSFDLAYHNGRGSIPVLNDTVYTDSKAVNPLVGGKKWFMIEGSLYSVQIDELGTVIDTHTC